MNRHLFLSPGKMILTFLIGGVIVLGSLTHGVWATPDQNPYRQTRSWEGLTKQEIVIDFKLFPHFSHLILEQLLERLNQFEVHLFR